MILAIIGLMSITNIVSGEIGIGGLVSEKLIMRQGINTGRLIVSLTGQGISPVIGTGGTVTTFDVNEITGDTINFKSSVLSLNGMPNATIYFNWGYTDALGNVSSNNIITAAGDYTISYVLPGYVPTKTVYYQAAIDTDGTGVGEKKIVSGVVTKNVVWQWYKLIIPLITLVALYVSYKNDSGIKVNFYILITGIVLYNIIAYIS
jgi:hypothetical protein